MKSVLIRLAGPLQGWSTQLKLGIRDTDREPSKSGVIGLVASAMGMERDDVNTLTELRQLQLAIRVDREGALLRDYQTAGGARFRGRPYVVHDAGVVPTERYLLRDACFTAALGGDDALVERVAHALRSPRWPLFLGRRACVPSEPMYLATVAAEPAVAVRSAPFAERADPGPLRLVLEAPPGEGEPRHDVPLSFHDGDRGYGLRYVRTEWLETGAVAVESEGGTTR